MTCVETDHNCHLEQPQTPPRDLDSDVLIGALLIMTLGAGNGDTVEVSGDDQAAVDAIAALVEQDLDA